MINLRKITLGLAATTFLAAGFNNASAEPVKLITADGRTVTVDSSQLRTVKKPAVKAKVVEPKTTELPPRAHQHNDLLAKAYWGFNIGANWLKDQDVVFNNSTIGQFEYDGDIEIGAIFGIDFLEHNFRGELELTSRSSSLDDATIDGDLDSTAFMLNGIYMARNKTRLTPYVGVGIGAANVGDEDESDNSFAYQGMAGVEYQIGRTGVGLGYKFFNASDLKFKFPTGNLKLDYQTHSALLTLRF